MRNNSSSNSRDEDRNKEESSSPSTLDSRFNQTLRNVQGYAYMHVNFTFRSSNLFLEYPFSCDTRNSIVYVSPISRVAFRICSMFWPDLSAHLKIRSEY